MASRPVRRDAGSRPPFQDCLRNQETFMTTLFKRIVLSTVFAVGLAGAASAQEKKTLIVAEPVHGTGYLPLYVAINKGYFSEQGIEVKILTVESGSGHTNAVLSGQAFAFIGGPEHNAFAKLKGAELRGVVNVVDRGNVYVVAAKGKGPAAGQTMADYFKGKTIATGQFGGTPNSITRYLLKQYKLDEKKDVTLQELPNSAVLAAVKTGGSQIGVTSEPFLTQGIKAGIWDEPIVNVPKELGPYAYSTLNIRLDSIQKDPETVRKFVVGVMKGLKTTYEDREEAVRIAKKEFPTMSVDDLMATLDRSFADEMWSKDGSISPKSWETGGSVVLSAGILKQPVPYEQIIDMQFVNAAQKTN
jgi:NitT/TauT family transport system substrate-binding protein